MWGSLCKWLKLNNKCNLATVTKNQAAEFSIQSLAEKTLGLLQFRTVAITSQRCKEPECSYNRPWILFPAFTQARSLCVAPKSVRVSYCNAGLPDRFEINSPSLMFFRKKRWNPKCLVFQNGQRHQKTAILENWFSAKTQSKFRKKYTNSPDLKFIFKINHVFIKSGWKYTTWQNCCSARASTVAHTNTQKCT